MKECLFKPNIEISHKNGNNYDNDSENYQDFGD